MMTSRTWTIEHPDLGGAVAVCGFVDRTRAWDHVRRHWLNPGECWERLCTGLLPGVFKKRLEEFRIGSSPVDAEHVPEAAALWASAADAYQGAVERHTAAPTVLVLALRVRHRDGGVGPLLQRYAVVSPIGFYAAWARGMRPSELRTALRQLNRGARRPPSVEDFVDGARDYAAGQVARHGTWMAQPRRGKGGSRGRHR